MALTVSQFEPWHIATLADSAAEKWVRLNYSELIDPAVLASGPAWTGRWDGQIIGSAGVVPLDGFSGMAWATLAPMSVGAARRATEACRAHLRTVPYHWIEAQVIDGFDTSLRWVQLVGFRPVNGVRVYDSDGREHHRFVFAKD
jgi:hypothetical protein